MCAYQYELDVSILFDYSFGFVASNKKHDPRIKSTGAVIWNSSLFAMTEDFFSEHKDETKLKVTAYYIWNL